MFNILKIYIVFTIIYPFCLKKLKLKNSKKLVANLHDRTEYVIHVRLLKQALNHGLVLNKVHTAIKFNQNAWLKSYIDRNTYLRKKQKTIWKKTFLSW